MKNNVTRLLVSAIFGFIFGILGILLFMNDTVQEYILGPKLIEDYFIYVYVVVWMLGFITTVAGLMMIRKIFNKANQNNLDPDELDVWINRTYYRAQDFTTGGLLLSLLTLVVTVTGIILIEETNTTMMLTLIILSIVLLIFSTYAVFYQAQALQKIYPEREIPSVDDKDYSDKLLKVSDEGERHLILTGLYKSNQTAQMSILVGVVFLTIVSIATETNQLLAIIVLLAIFALNAFKYTQVLKKEM